MELVGKPVPHRHAGVLRQLLNGSLREAAVLDAVEHTAQHAGGILHRLLDADLRTGRPEIGHVRTLVIGRHLEGAAGAGRCLLEDKGDVLAGKSLLLGAGLLGGLELGCKVQQVLDLGRSKIQQLQEAAILEIDCHISIKV